MFVGGIWHPDAARSVTSRKPDGSYNDLKIEIVGLDDECEVQTGWGGPWGFSSFVGYFNIGIRGGPDAFNVRANEPCGMIVVDGCWFLPNSSTSTADAAIHCANWHTLVVRRTRARGVTPTDPPQLFRQHNFYFKNSGPGGIFIVENEFQGSNGTCFQIRPGKDEAYLSEPQGPVVIAYNRSVGYGWEWGNTPATEHGGAAITVWSSPKAPVFIYKNSIVDARYGCLVVSQQPASPWEPYGDRNWYNDAGYPIQHVYLADNEFSNPRSQRNAVSITGCQSASIWGDNKLGSGGVWTLNSEWSARNGYSDIRIGSVKLYGESMLGENFWTFDGTVTRKMTAVEVEALRQPAGTPLTVR